VTIFKDWGAAKKDLRVSSPLHAVKHMLISLASDTADPQLLLECFLNSLAEHFAQPHVTAS